MEFTFIAGALALDLTGTLRNRSGDPRDLLPAPADLARWSVAAGLLTDPPPAGPADLAAARELREAIYRAATAVLRGTAVAAGDRDLINLRAAAAPPVPRLTGAGGARRDGDITAVLSAVARDAIGLLADVSAGRPHGPAQGVLKECEAAHCTRLYLDTSRRRTRRWCDMRECGNRAKAAAFRARRTTPAGEPE